jgi:hypothetical protein
MRRAWALFVLVSTTSLIARAQQGTELHIEWNAPPECPDIEYVKREVRRRVGPPSSGDKSVSAVAKVRRVGEAWRVDLATRGDDAAGHRSFTADSCRGVANATGLIVALMVNPERVAQNAKENAGKDVDEKAASTPPASPSPPRTETPGFAGPAVRRTMKGTVAAFALSDVATAPNVGWGAGIAIGIATGPFRFEAVGAAEPGHDAPVSAHPGAFVTFRTWSAGARGCIAASRAELEVRACGGYELDYAKVTSFGVAQPGAGSTTWNELLAGGGIRWAALGDLGLRADAFAGFPIERRAFQIQPLGVIHTLPHVAWHFAVGIDARF